MRSLSGHFYAFRFIQIQTDKIDNNYKYKSFIEWWLMIGDVCFTTIVNKITPKPYLLLLSSLILL